MCFASDLPPRGAPGHTQPSGPYLNGVHIMELEKGWQHDENRVIEDSFGNQYFFQRYIGMEPPHREKMSCYWIAHKVTEEIATIGPFRIANFSTLWDTGNPKALPELFKAGYKDSIACYLKSLEPYDKGFMDFAIKDYNLTDLFVFSDTIKAYDIKNLDNEPYSELICLDLSWKDEFPGYGLPSSLLIFKPDDAGQFADKTSQFQATTGKWDEELEKYARESFDNHRILACINLAMSLKNHGRTDFMKIIEEIINDPKGYVSGSVPGNASGVIEKLKNLTSETR